MNPELFKVMAVAFSVWGALVALKAAKALRSNTKYEFSMWDGGALRVGKTLNKLGKQIKVVVGVAMSAGCVAMLVGAVPVQTASYALMFVALLSIVSDFVTIER